MSKQEMVTHKKHLSPCLPQDADTQNTNYFSHFPITGKNYSIPRTCRKKVLFWLVVSAHGWQSLGQKRMAKAHAGGKGVQPSEARKESKKNSQEQDYNFPGHIPSDPSPIRPYILIAHSTTEYINGYI